MENNVPSIGRSWGSGVSRWHGWATDAGTSCRPYRPYFGR